MQASAVFTHPRDAAVAVVHRDGTQWRYDYATVAARDPRVVGWRSAARGTTHVGPAAYAALLDVERTLGRALPDAEAAAVLPRATRFNRAAFRTRRAHNQR